MTFSGRTFRLGIGAAALALASADAAARIYPAWSPSGTYDISFDPGFVSVAGGFSFPLGGEPASITLHYEDAGGVAGGGLAGNFTLYSLTGSYSIDPTTREQSVHLADPAKVPLFTFDGVVSPSGNDIVGTFTRKAGYLDYPGDEAGALTLHRTGDAAQTRFSLALATRMDDRGRIRGRLAPDGRTETTAQVRLYDGRVVTLGKIRGRVKTDVNGITTGSVAIRGRKWRADLAGPIDVDGFHATLDLNASGFVVSGIPIVLAVQPGPTPPVGPPPKPPANQLSGATATIVNGQVTITHSTVPSRFFGKPAGISIQFPLSDAMTVVTADFSTASIPSPRRCIVTLGSATYGTVTAPAGNGVTFDIKKLSSVRDGVIEVLATGKVFNSGGNEKSVNVLVQAAVQ